MADADAIHNMLEWANFNKRVELNTWTFNADRRHILWHLSSHSYAPALGRRLAFWALHERLDKGCPVVVSGSCPPRACETACARLSCRSLR